VQGDGISFLRSVEGEVALKIELTFIMPLFPSPTKKGEAHMVKF